MLTEAGYPNGFRVDLFFTRDETVTEEISRYLEAVGIRTNLKFRDKWREIYLEIVSGNAPLFFVTSGGYSIFDAASIMNLYFPLSSPRCFGSNRQINELLAEADITIDPILILCGLCQVRMPGTRLRAILPGALFLMI